MMVTTPGDVTEMVAIQTLSSAPPDQWGALLEAIGASIHPAERRRVVGVARSSGEEAPCTVTSLLGMFEQDGQALDGSQRTSKATSSSALAQTTANGRVLRGRRNQRAVAAPAPTVVEEDPRDIEELLRELGESPMPSKSAKKKSKATEEAKQQKAAERAKERQAEEQRKTQAVELEGQCEAEESELDLAGMDDSQLQAAEEHCQPEPPHEEQRPRNLAGSNYCSNNAFACLATEASTGQCSSSVVRGRSPTRGSGDSRQQAAWNASASAASCFPSDGVGSVQTNEEPLFLARPSVGTWLQPSPPKMRNQRQTAEAARLAESQTGQEDSWESCSPVPAPRSRSWHAQPSVGTWLTRAPVSQQCATPSAEPDRRSVSRGPAQLWPATPESTPPSSPRGSCSDQFVAGETRAPIYGCSPSQQIVWVPVPVELLPRVQQVLSDAAGATWNREHTSSASKGASMQDEKTDERQVP